MKKIKYGNLSWSIKVAVLGGWLIAVVVAVAFVVGVVEGILA